MVEAGTEKNHFVIRHSVWDFSIMYAVIKLRNVVEPLLKFSGICICMAKNRTIFKILNYTSSRKQYFSKWYLEKIFLSLLFLKIRFLKNLFLSNKGLRRIFLYI